MVRAFLCLAVVVSLTVASGAHAATKTVTVPYPTKVKYRFGPGKVIDCAPYGHIGLSCTSPKRAGAYSLTEQFVASVISWNGKVAAMVSGTTAHAGTVNGATDVSIRQDGFVTALVQNVFTVIAGGESVEVIVADEGYADVWRNGDFQAAPSVADAKNKKVAKYDEATDTLEVTNGRWKTVISSWSSPTPTIQVLDAGAQVFAG